MVRIKYYYLIFLSLFISCNLTPEKYVHLQSEVKQCNTYNEVLATYSRYGITPTWDKFFIKTSFITLEYQKYIYFNSSTHGDKIEVFYDYVDKHFVFDNKKNIQTVFLYENGVFENNTTPYKTKYIVTKVGNYLIVYVKEKDMLYLQDCLYKNRDSLR
jgi:hypothetical protein